MKMHRSKETRRKKAPNRAAILQWLTLARDASRNRARFTCEVAKMPPRDRAKIVAKIQAACASPKIRKQRDRRRLHGLQYLVENAERFQQKKIERQTLRENIKDEQRRKTAEVASRHSQGELIGQTEVVQFKSPKSDIRWATKPKRRP